MFTGLIEDTGTVTAVLPKTNLTRLSVRAGKLARGVKRGDSVAVDGVCLTAVAVKNGVLHFDCIRETLEKTTLGTLHKGSRVNLERALKASSRLGGHLVAGHVDAVARITAVEQRKNYTCYRFRLKKALAKYLAPKGSVCIDGISLTLGEVKGGAFSVFLIPETLRATTLGEKTKGTPVNVEVDLIARYIAALMKG